VEEMVKSEEFKEIREANKRHISPKQWRDLLHMAEVTGNKREWIDEIFTFENGKIISDGYLTVRNCKELKSLPERLEIIGGFDIFGCTGLTSLPEGLKVLRGYLYMSHNLNKQVQEDAERLEKQKEIGGLVFA